VGRRATPTAAGTELVEYARRIGALVDSAVDGMAQHASGVTGRVRIGTGGTACIYVLPPALREMRRRFPSLEITVQTGNTGDILNLLDANVIDVALVTLPAPGRVLDVTPLLRDELVLVAANQTPLPRLPTAESLAGEPMILYESGGHTRRLVDDWFRSANVRSKPIMELGSVEAIKELVAVGLGLSILPRIAVVHRNRELALALRSLRPKLHRTLAAVVRRDKPRSRAVRETLAALERLSQLKRRSV
jgi:DNA-binding transcriptional LysR family regulator